MTNLEDVRNNITESVNEEADVDGLALTDTQLFTRDGEKGSSHEDEDDPSDTSQRVDFHEALDEFSESTREPYLSIDGDNAPLQIPYLLPDLRQEMEHPEDYYQSHHSPATMSVPIIAFLDPARISDGKIDVPIAAALSEVEDTSSGQLDQLKNDRDEIQRNVQDYIDGSTLSVDPDYWRLTSPPSQIPLLYEPPTMENQYASDVHPEVSLPIAAPRVDIVAPLFWTSDADIDYPKDSHDMETAAHIIFRPLFRFRQRAQQRSWRRDAYNDYQSAPYRRYNSYNPYAGRNYQY